ncbi:hypothetical protein [Microcella frigidaquae]|uniref:Uncharacterized protein n=1 Tax=Microcella frigidaquae TaxID=424758 RepID=A0A840XA60_9MICO|nr:hypothetical protein [Microcella frigidaquae]MBB5618074.1 hypothetical protein [Microcella frigidaquae]NHN45638.1 hypothetical protein [Microcella frigidaquae]
MSATHPAPFGRTARSADEILADARAATDFWAGLEHLDAARRNAILREAEPSRQIDVPMSSPPPAAALLPPPRLGRQEHAREHALERRRLQLWLERATHPTHQLLSRLRAERDAIRTEASEPRRPRVRYVRGEINPVGMSYQRAPDIAIACLDREAELAGEPMATRARVVDGLPALGLGS